MLELFSSPTSPNYWRWKWEVYRASPPDPAGQSWAGGGAYTVLTLMVIPYAKLGFDPLGFAEISWVLPFAKSQFSIPTWDLPINQRWFLGFACKSQASLPILGFAINPSWDLTNPNFGIWVLSEMVEFSWDLLPISWDLLEACEES